jgi:baculoviral IAP repeat-containing protein 6
MPHTATFEKSKSCGLEEWMWGDGEIIWEMQEDRSERPSSVFARDPPLFENFKRLNKQCEAFLAGASQMMTGEDGNDEDVEEMVQATSLCGDITAAREDIERTMVALGRLPPSDHSRSSDKVEESHEAAGTKGKGKNRDPTVDMEKAYSIECERLAFKHVDTLSDNGRNGFGRDYENYNYAGQLRQTASATRNPKDRLHLIKELAVMATCLPPGVWVRVDEVRHDAM